MSYKPTKLDVITDFRRSIMASFSKEGFKDMNARTFLRKAETNLKELELSKNSSSLITERLEKAKNPKQPIEKRREDLLTASSLI
jgi:hypothetical protein